MSTETYAPAPAKLPASAPRPNKFPGTCAMCSQNVAPEEGTCRKPPGAKRFVVTHKIGQCPPAAGPATTVEVTPFQPLTPPAPKVVKVEVGVYRHGSDIYVVRMKNKRYGGGKYRAAYRLVESAPRMTEHGTVIPFDLRYAGRIIYDLTPEERMPLADAEAITAKYGHCLCCGRSIWAAESVKQGIGPVCVKTYFGKMALAASN